MAVIFGLVLSKAWGADLALFSNQMEYQSFVPTDSAFSIYENIRRRLSGWGGGTNFNSIFDSARKEYDRIVILSDEQGWMPRRSTRWASGGEPSSALKDYRKKFECNPKIFVIDLAHYGTLMFPERNIYNLSGFSEKIFDIMCILEKDPNALLTTIENVDI